MITYKSNNNNVYFYILDDFKIDFNLNLNFNFKDFLNVSKENQKNFFYANMEHALKKHIAECIIKIENYAELQEYKPLIVFLHCLTINRIKLKKHMRIGKFIQLEIPIMHNLNTETIEWHYKTQLDFFKKLEKEQENQYEKGN